MLRNDADYGETLDIFGIKRESGGDWKFVNPVVASVIDQDILKLIFTHPTYLFACCWSRNWLSPYWDPA